MATKRKRASFSPTIIVDSQKESEEPGEKPVLQQVVELVMEDQKEEDVEFADKPSQEIVEDLRRRIKEEVKQELKAELSHELREALLQQIEQKIQERMFYQSYQERVSALNQEEHSPLTDQEEKVAVVEEQSDDSQQSVQSLENKEEQSRHSEERRKETVAELFGKSSDGVMPEITIHTQRRTRGFLLWAITMIAIAIGVGGGLILFTNLSQRTDQQSFVPVVPNAKSTTPTITSSPKPSPTPSPTVSVNKKDIKIQVQNGAGVVGAASKMKAFLEKKGYTVVDVGNASTYSYEETEILVKSSKSAIRDILEEDLSESYTVGRIETTLPESAPYDVRVIVGKK